MFKNFVVTFIVIVQLLLAFIFEYEISQLFLLLICMLGTCTFISGIKSIKNNLAVLFLFIFIFCSLHIQALFQFQASSFVLTDEANSERAYHDLAYFANEVLAIFSVSYFFLNKKIKFREVNTCLTQNKYFKDKYFNLSLLVAYIFSAISFVLGVGKMGYEASVVLPFHLNGVMQFYRTDIFPLIIAVYFFDKTTNHLPINKTHIGLIVLWALMESVVRLSRGAVVMSFLPLLFMIIYSNQLNKKFIIKVLTPLLIIAFTMFPIISALRQGGEVSLQTVQQSSKEEDENAKQHIFLRTFYSGVYFTRMYPNGFDDSNMFFFDRAPAVLLLGGSAVYTTRVIDGISENVVHSSGTTGILDPLIIGGKGFCYAMIVILVLLAILIDRRIGNQKILFKIVCLLIFKILVMSKNITVLLDSESIQLLTSYILQFLIVRYYYNICYKLKI